MTIRGCDLISKYYREFSSATKLEFIHSRPPSSSSPCRDYMFSPLHSSPEYVFIYPPLLPPPLLYILYPPLPPLHPFVNLNILPSSLLPLYILYIDPTFVPSLLIVYKAYQPIIYSNIHLLSVRHRF